MQPFLLVIPFLCRIKRRLTDEKIMGYRSFDRISQQCEGAAFAVDEVIHPIGIMANKNTKITVTLFNQITDTMEFFDFIRGKILVDQPLLQRCPRHLRNMREYYFFAVAHLASFIAVIGIGHIEMHSVCLHG
jgi:hypothetical protein